MRTASSPAEVSPANPTGPKANTSDLETTEYASCASSGRPVSGQSACARSGLQSAKMMKDRLRVNLEASIGKTDCNIEPGFGGSDLPARDQATRVTNHGRFPLPGIAAY